MGFRTVLLLFYQFCKSPSFSPHASLSFFLPLSLLYVSLAVSAPFLNLSFSLTHTHTAGNSRVFSREQSPVLRS